MKRGWRKYGTKRVREQITLCLYSMTRKLCHPGARGGGNLGLNISFCLGEGGIWRLNFYTEV